MVFHYHTFTLANFMTEPSCNLPVCWIGYVVGQGAAQGKGACANRQPTLELVAGRPTHCSQAWPATPDTHTNTHTQIHKKRTVPGSGQVRSWEMRSRRQHRMATDIKVRTQYTVTHTDTCTGTYMVGHFKHIPQHAQHCRKMPLCTSVMSAWVSKWATDKHTHK